MISFFPDLNVWLALSVSAHEHSDRAWKWRYGLRDEVRLLFCRYTQLGLLRLLTNFSVMGEQTLTIRKAWHVYDRWLDDVHVQFHPEPRGIDVVFREVTKPLAARSASKSIGDCYLLAYAKHTQSALVTFDAALHELAERQDCRSVMPR